MDVYQPPIEKLQTRFYNPWHELAVLALMGMELSWVSMWYSALSSIGRRVPYFKAFVVLGVILVGTHFLARFFNTQTTRKWVRRTIFSSLILISLYLALSLLLYWPNWPSVVGILEHIWASFVKAELIPPEFWVMLAILLIWRRGVGLARRPMSVDQVLSSFQIGALSFFIYGLVAPLLDYNTVLFALGAFLFTGLIAMSCGRIVDTARSRGGKIKQMTRGWVAGIVMTSLAAVGIGLGLSGLLQGRLGDLLGQGILVLITLIIGLAFLIVLPVIWLLVAIMPWLEKLVSNLAIFSFLIQIGDTISKLLQAAGNTNLDNIANKIAVAKPYFFVGILVLVILGILGALSLRNWLRNLEIEKNDEDLLSGQDLLAMWRASLRKRLKEQRERFTQRFRMGQAEKLLAAARIRWIYRQMMKLSTSLGSPRHPAVTPLEFLPRLHELLPQTGEAADLITNAYLRVRYGELPETREEAERVVAAWEKVQAQGRKLRKKVIKKDQDIHADWYQPPRPPRYPRGESDYTKHV